MTVYDAIVVGSGPNGLAAAIVLAQAGLSVLVREANPTIGGAARTLELTLPGFLHDIGSAVHPMAVSSPFFQSLSLERYGLEWIQPPIPLVHPLDGEPPCVLERSISSTASTLGLDQSSYVRLLEPLVRNWPSILPEILSPMLRLPTHPFAMMRFGLPALLPATALNALFFRGTRARALFAGLACHSIIPLNSPASSAIGLVMAIVGHTAGWPVPRGGSQSISNALASCFQSHGGVIETNAPVESIEDLPDARAVLFDTTPRQFVQIAHSRLTPGAISSLNRFRYGPGVFKIDWALSQSIPWTNPILGQTATLHLGGSAESLAVGERSSWSGRTPTRPFVIFAQQSLFDPTRAPLGKHTAWAYCHVPNGSTADMTQKIEDEVERFAPGFRDIILARSTRNTVAMHQMNANLIGGDIGGGANNLSQILIRPVLALDPYRTAARDLYLCSSSTPPGGGVHGMCGYHSARSALRHTFGRRVR